MKTVYRVEGAVIREWAAPADEVVVRPFTEIAPPISDDIIVKGFDWNNSEYIVEKVVPVAVHEALQGGFEDIAMMVGMLFEAVFPAEEELPEEGPTEEDSGSGEEDTEEPAPIPEEPEIPETPPVEEPENPEEESEAVE